MVNYARYGLEQNPYISKELDPLTCPADEKRLLDVDGFSTHKADVDDILKEAVQKRVPAFFLLAGNSGTGRSSVANWILARYCYHRRIPQSRLFIPRRKTLDYDYYHTLLNWFCFLKNIIEACEDIDLGKKLNESLATLASTAKIETMVPTFAGLAHRISTSLDAQKGPGNTGQPAAFAICLEQVKDYQLIRAVIDVFEEIPTVAVFTTYDLENAGKEVTELFRQAKKGPIRKIIKLGPVTAPEVGVVVGKRWSEASKYSNQPPFDISAVGQVLGQLPLGRVLVLMSGLIDLKLAAYSDDSAWPDDQRLLLTSEQIHEFVNILDRNL